MSAEKQRIDIAEAVAMDIEYVLGDVLDRHHEVQETFFGACITYADNFSSETYEAVEHTVVDMEFSLVATITAIQERYKDSPVKQARYVHGLIVADDRMRSNLFNDLVPGTLFKPYADYQSSQQFDTNVAVIIAQKGITTVLNEVTKSAVNFLNSDVAMFGEAVAVPDYI